MSNRFLVTALAATLVVGSALAGEAPRNYLNIGDTAPALTPAKWLKGEAISKFEKGNIYVVEFWATWCGPCKENIPHLTEMAKKYAGKAKIAGISIWESNDPTNTSYLAKVEDFVKTQGDHMDYNVAVDGPENKVANAWMKAADENGIPMSFIVGRDGKIAWMGHPSNLENVLTQVIDNKFDVAAAREKRATDVEVTRPIREAMTAKNWMGAVTLMDKAILKKPESARFYTYDRLVALFHAKPEVASVEADKILEESNGDIGAYRMIVSIFASQKDLSPAAYKYGDKTADAALAKDEMKYMFLAMSAEIKSQLGDKTGAVKMQEEAVKAASTDSHCPPDFLTFLKKNLDGFKKAAGQ